MFRAEQGVEDPPSSEAMEPFLAEVAELDNVQSVISPYTPEGEQQIAREGPNAGLIAYAELEVAVRRVVRGDRRGRSSDP